MSGFEATFLGHHSWLFRAGRSSILVDPLLCDDFGHTEAVGLRVYPPRTVRLDRLGKVSAVFLTHEHEGHFDIPSLMRLERRIPILIPRGSSIAMRQVLAELGFVVTLVEPGKLVQVGSLRLLPLAADQVNDAIIEEWDSTAYVVYDDQGHGSFFSHVDMPVSEAMRKAVHSAVKRPVVWARTNNFSDMYFQYHRARPNRAHFRTFVWHTLEDHRATVQRVGKPDALLLVGGGFSFKDRRLNSSAFVWTSEDVEGALKQLLPEERILWTVPGQTLSMRRGKLESVAGSRPGVRVRPRSAWPSRRFREALRWPVSYAPASGKKTFEPAENDALQTELDLFARHLYGGLVFREMYSLNHGELGKKKPTFAISALVDGRSSAQVYEYEPHACRFRGVECRDPVTEYWGVYECWASDLLAFLRAEVSSTTLSFGRSRIWNGTPASTRFPIQRELFVYAHPLRMPERFLQLYRAVAGRKGSRGQGSGVRGRRSEAGSQRSRVRG